MQSKLPLNLFRRINRCRTVFLRREIRNHDAETKNYENITKKLKLSKNKQLLIKMQKKHRKSLFYTGHLLDNIWEHITV